MVGMPEIYVLGVGMGSKMLALVCCIIWCVFCAFVLENDIYIYIYILEKLLRNILILSKNAEKTFAEICNNPVNDVNSRPWICCSYHNNKLPWNSIKFTITHNF